MSQPPRHVAMRKIRDLRLASPLQRKLAMMPVKTTAAVLAASMTLFSVAPAAAANARLDPRGRRTVSEPASGSQGPQGTTPIAPSSSGSGAVGPTGNSSGSTSSGNGGSNNGGSIGNPGSLGGGMIGSGINGAPSVPGTPGTSSTPGTAASPISNGGTNVGRPGPRAPHEEPGNNTGRGPFSEAPRTTDGTENRGFNLGGLNGILTGLNQFSSTVMNLVWTFSMLKSVFGWFGGTRERSGDRVREVVAVSDRGTNVSRDSNTKVDEKLEDERRRAEGGGTGNGGGSDGTEEAQASGLSRN